MSDIFIVEDDEMMTRVYERAFRMAGYASEIMQDGAEAWKRLSEREPLPSAIVLDLSVPNLNGEEILKRIKSDARLKDIPVAILTNSTRIENAEKYRALGAAEFLIKIEHEPLDMVSRVKALIKNSDASQAAAA